MIKRSSSSSDLESPILYLRLLFPYLYQTAWGVAGAVEMLLIAYMRQTTGSYRGALHVIAGVIAVSALLPILVSPPHEGSPTREAELRGPRRPGPMGRRHKGTRSTKSTSSL